MDTISLAALHEQHAYYQVLGPTVQLVIAASTAAPYTTDGQSVNPAPLVPGARYAVCSPYRSCYIRQSGPGIDVSSSDRVLAAGQFAIIDVDDTTQNRLSVLSVNSATGWLYITRIDSFAGENTAAQDLWRQQFFSEKIGASLDVAAGVASTTSVPLMHGARYRVECPTLDPTGVQGQAGDDVLIRQGAAGVSAASSGADCGLLLVKGQNFIFNVNDATDDTLAVLSATGGAASSVRITRIDAVT